MRIDSAQVPDGWRLARLGQVAEVVGGSTPSRARPEFWGGDIPWVVPSELTELAGRYLQDSRESITIDGLKSAGLRVLPTGSILLTTRATIGLAAISTLPIATNQGFQNLVGKNGTDSLWLYYCISSKRRELERRGAGSTFREVSRDSVRALPILLPPLAEQRAIAAVLDSIDEAIESADEVIAATERLRDALLHELLTRGLPGQHSEWQEVPGLGTIPACWQVVRLGDVAEVSFSSVDKKTVAGEISVRLCNYTDVFYNRRVCIDMPFMEVTASPTEFQRWALREGDVLFTKDSETVDEIGVPAYVASDMPGVLCGYHLGLARPIRTSMHGAFLARALESQVVSREFSRIANGITRFGLTLDATRALRLLLPPLLEQRAIAAVLDSVDASIEQAREERVALAVTATSVADALLTGRVRVDQREK